MFDFAAWTHRASTFLRRLIRLPGEIGIADSIEPPGDSEFDQEWLHSKECDLPSEIRHFVSTASARCSFWYRWVPPPDLCRSVSDLLGERTAITGGGDMCELAKYCVSGKLSNPFGIPNLYPPYSDSVALERRHGRTPIMQFQSGVAISLGTAIDGIRPVLYVTKAGEGPCRVLSPSFEQFLLAWEKTCYTDADLDGLAPWLDTTTGQLVPDADKSREFCRILLGE